MVPIKNKKNSLQSTIIALDTTAETRLLTDIEHEQLEQARDNLAKLLQKEEIKYYQRCQSYKYPIGG